MPFAPKDGWLRNAAWNGFASVLEDYARKAWRPVAECPPPVDEAVLVWTDHGVAVMRKTPLGEWRDATAKTPQRAPNVWMPAPLEPEN